jgi:peptide/nickel transport system permease protein
MIGFLIRRVSWAIFLFFAASMVTYVIFYVIPVNPALLAAGSRGNGRIDPHAAAVLAHRMGLDQPIWKQYALFVWDIVRHGDFGHSYQEHIPVRPLITAAAPVTASLVLGGAVLWLAVSFPIGVFSALHPRSLFDRGAMFFVLIGISAHPVWIGLILVYVFSIKLGWFPIGNYCHPLAHEGPAVLCGGPAQWAYHMILPWVTFMLLFAALYVRLIRATVMETLSEDYIRTARAKGAPERRVLVQHVLRNSLIPVVTILGMDIGLALGGAVFTETIFNLPGIGDTLISGATTYDLPIVVGITVWICVCVIFFNLIVDILYGIVDPRVRLA